MTDSERQRAVKASLKGLDEAGLANLMGWDTQRIWATGVQAFRAEDHVMFVFREQVKVETEGKEAPEIVARNVGSVVMPIKVALAFQKVLDSVMADSEEGHDGAT